MSISKIHERFMLEALREAKKACKKDEVPVGAVVVYGNKIIGRGHNQPITSNDPSAHAEIIALRGAAKKMYNYRLNEARLYVTVEPCPMCAGALVNARVKEIIFGCADAKAGACGSVMNVANSRKLNHRIKVTRGICERQCRGLMQGFFKSKRPPLTPALSPVLQRQPD